MNYKSQNPINVSQKQRIKLYKSGKLWLAAGLTFVSFAGGAIVNNTNVHADTVATATTSATSTSTSDTTSAASQATTQSASVSSSSTTATSASVSTASSTATSATSTSTTSQATSSSTSTASSAATSSSTSTASSAATSSSTTTASTATSQATSSVNTATSQATKAVTSTATSQATSTASSTAASQATSVSASASSKAVVESATVTTAATTAATTTDVWTIGDTTRPRVDVVDVSSYQSTMTQADFNKLKTLGVKTVIVKSTEGTTYVNGSALSQAQMANKAGLNVDFYHYATFSTTTDATAEATNMANYLVKNKVSTKVLLFADMEDSQTYSVNAEANLNAFWTTLNSYGYTNHAVYTSTTYLYRDAVIRTVGTSRVWRAQYPYTPSADSLWNSSDAAWQFSSTALLPTGSDYTGYLDVSMSYTGLTEDSAGTNTFVTTSTDTNTGSTNTNTGSTNTGNTNTNTGSTNTGNTNTNTGSTNTGNTNTSTGNTSSTTNTNNKTTTQKTSGWYTFTANTAIKSAAKDSAKTVGTYSKGNRVYYNAKVTTNGETWLRYLSYSGAQHYVKIGSATTTTTKPNTSTSTTTAAKGTYTFTGTTAIKGSASDSASTVGTYYKGNTVNYNAKVTVNGATWLRYLSYSGAQHYVKISSSTNTATTKPSTSTSTTTAAKGTYTFTSTTAIKGSASDSASTVGTYYKGNTVNYNAKVTVNGATWLRYQSYSGAQHYVKVSGASTTTSNSSTSTATAATGRYTFKTTTNIRTGASLSASVTGQYYAGESVYYVGKVSADGYQWLKYVSNSGAYHFVAVIG